MLSVTYMKGAELPSLTVDWKDQAGTLIDFSTGHTFELRVGKPGQTATLTKTTGIVGAATSPNVTVNWAASGELNTLAEDHYIADLIATRSSDNKQRVMRFGLLVDTPILP